MAPAAFIFDFYGTLAETRGAGPTWEGILAEAGHRLDGEARFAYWNGGVDGDEHDEHSRSRDHYVAWQRQRVGALLAASGVPECDHDLLTARLLSSFVGRPLTAYDEVAAVLADLRARGHTLAVCSNWDWDLHEALATAGLTGAFDLVVSSAWVGARKPHARIYAHTLGELGVDAADAVFVGDTWTCDVEGPRAAGMDAVYIRRPHLGDDATALPDVAAGARDGVTYATDLTAVVRLAR